MINLGRATKNFDECIIIGYYLDIPSIPCVICNPLREDIKPSLGIYSRDGLHIYYVDFATTEKGSIIDLLGKIWKTDYNTTINRINNDLKDIASIEKIKSIKNKFRKNLTSQESNIILKCKTRNWTNYDIEYWSSYGVSLDWLKFADIYPISHKIIIKEGRTMTFPADKYTYTFVEFRNGNITHKFYSPFNTQGFKWQNNHHNGTISLWNKIPDKGDVICICSSVKDCLCVWSNTGIPCICPQGEGYMLQQGVIDELKRRFKLQVISFDGDKAGVEDSMKLSLLSNFKVANSPSIDVTIDKKAKDWSDIYHYFGKDFFMRTIRDTFKNLLTF